MIDWAARLALWAALGSLVTVAIFLRGRKRPAEPLVDVRKRFPLSVEDAVRLADLALMAERAAQPQRAFTVARAEVREFQFGYVIGYASGRGLTGGAAPGVVSPGGGSILVDRVTRQGRIVEKLDVGHEEGAWRAAHLREANLPR